MEETIPTQLLDNKAPVDRVVLVGAPTKDIEPRLAEEHLNELARLTDTAGGEVAAVVRQRINAPNPSLYIGSGKAEELRATVEASGASLVIIDEPRCRSSWLSSSTSFRA